MSNQARDGKVKPGEFPFPLTGGAKESRFLTWLRNHSNYMAVRGFLDYLRMVAVLVRGILVNNLVVLPALLLLAFALSLAYGTLLYNWENQVDPMAVADRKVKKAEDEEEAARNAQKLIKAAQKEGNFVVIADFGKPHQELDKLKKNVVKAREERDKIERGKQPITFFVAKEYDPSEDAAGGWVLWMQDTFGLVPPFLFTPIVLVLAALWVLLSPIWMLLSKISGYNKSLATGSDSSVKTRDRYERSFGAALLVILVVALFEFLPILIHLYHQLRMLYRDESLPLKEMFAAASAALVALSGAPRLLSFLGGIWKKLATTLVALLGLLAPLLVILFVTDFLVYGFKLPAEHIVLWILALLSLPFVFSFGVAVAMLVGFFKRTFSVGEYIRLCGWFLLMIFGQIVLFVILLVGYGVMAAIPDEHLPQIFEALSFSPFFVLAWAFEIWLFCWLTVDINLTSIHGLYRDRLASAYLLGVNADDEVDIEQDVPLGELCCHETLSTAPYHLINVALNLQGSQDIGLRDRRSDFFIFSKKFIGGERTGYCRTSTMEQVFPQIDLASAMAISAAAASPNMGRATNPALVAFMTLLNIRLGVWAPNPGLLEEDVAGHKHKENEPHGFTFAEVFLNELISVRKRRALLTPAGPEISECTGPTVALGLAGLAFSGGGIRSATLNLGIAQALHHAGIFDHFDYLSTVSGGGYLGSAISTLMRNKTRPVSDIAGAVTLETDPASGDKIVHVTGSPTDGTRTYRYAKYAELLVKSGDWVKPGTRLVRRPGPRSEIAGIVAVTALPDGQQVVRVTGDSGESREYHFAKYDLLLVKHGDRIQAGHLLIAQKNSFGNRFRWRIRPSALMSEMTMRLDEKHPWVNLSDGGHIENLAAIELLRRRCKFIVIGDGEADPDHHFNGLANLLRCARIDLGIEIDIQLKSLRLNEERCCLAHCAIGKIAYPGEAECGYLLYLKSSCLGDEDESIGEYRHRNPEFPHESTADQFFDEGQFEAYRALGQRIGEKAVDALRPEPSATNLTFAAFASGCTTLWERASQGGPRESL